MKKKMTLLFTLMALSFMFAFAAPSEADGVVGYWLNPSKEAKIQIFKDDKTNTYWGRIVWLKFPLNEEGKPKVDKHNPDEKLRTRPILNMNILKNFKYDSDNKKFIDGTIYDAKSGKTYHCKMTLADANTLSIRGYVGISLIGRTEDWSRTTE